MSWVRTQCMPRCGQGSTHGPYVHDGEVEGHQGCQGEQGRLHMTGHTTSEVHPVSRSQESLCEQESSHVPCPPGGHGELKGYGKCQGKQGQLYTRAFPWEGCQICWTQGMTTCGMSHGPWLRRNGRERGIYLGIVCVEDVQTEGGWQGEGGLPWQMSLQLMHVVYSFSVLS